MKVKAWASISPITGKITHGMAEELDVWRRQPMGSRLLVVPCVISYDLPEKWKDIKK